MTDVITDDPRYSFDPITETDANDPPEDLDLDEPQDDDKEEAPV